jgi:hypothetical protein
MTIHAARWQAAQAAERTYWYATDARAQAARRREVYERAQWIASMLDITPATVTGRSVIDIGGGPQPIVAWPELSLSRRVLLDPLPLDTSDAVRLTHVRREAVPAEHYQGDPVDEAWGYNVLQHVIDPAAVLATAMRHATVIRWFEWVEQPACVVHPHVITAATFAPLDAWTRVVWYEGVRDEGRGWAQSYIAGVWEKPA